MYNPIKTFVVVVIITILVFFSTSFAQVKHEPKKIGETSVTTRQSDPLTQDFIRAVLIQGSLGTEDGRGNEEILIYPKSTAIDDPLSQRIGDKVCVYAEVVIKYIGPPHIITSGFNDNPNHPVFTLQIGDGNFIESADFGVNKHVDNPGTPTENLFVGHGVGSPVKMNDKVLLIGGENIRILAKKGHEMEWKIFVIEHYGDSQFLKSNKPK